MAQCTSCGAALVEGANFCFKCGRAIAATTSGDPLIGRTIGAYRIVSALGQGAMGRVYRAEQVNLGRQVCLKTLLPHLSANPVIVQRFEREARSVSALNHPNIVGVHDFGRTPDGMLYLVMELVDGSSLRAVMLQEHPLALGRALEITEQILSALEEAHAAGVVHRDLKPENVLVGKLKDGRDLVKVVDFGIAKLVGPDVEGNRLTGTGMVCGTPGYMAPEQIAGEEQDARVDVYAAGVVLFELLTGVPPFAGNDAQELLKQHLTGTPPSPSKVSKLPLPAALDAITLKALSNAREPRYRSALEFKRALEAFRASSRPATQVAVPSSARGTSVPCPSCGHEEPSGRKFCGECGAALTGAPATSGSLPGATPTLRQLMPQKLLEHLQDLSSMLEGERRKVTVLFGDISGFTAMGEAMDPEDVRELTNRCFDGMVEAVNRYGGTVDKFIGDCIMALFGAPNAHEDDPQRAVRCALDMQRYLGELNKTLAKPLGFRIGINTGEVVAGGVGGRSRMDYTVMGDVVNTAQRLQTAAPVGGILVSAAVRDLVQDSVALRALEPVKVKGKKEPLVVYAVEGLRGASEADRELLVGRERELAAIRGVLDAARAGRAGALLVLGEGGMGKSRLLREAGGRATVAGMRTAWARPGRYGAPAPLELLREVTFALCGGAAHDARDADLRLGELGRLGLGASELARLRHLFGSAAAPAGFERDEARQLDRAAMLELFARACEPGGLCLLLDDLHLADAASLELVDALRAAMPNGKLAVIAAARPGNTSGLLAGAPRLELAGLARADVVALARAQLAGSPLPPEAEELVAQRAEGNPLFTREVMRSLIDAGGLQLQGGRWQPTASLAAVQLPESLQLLVGARLDSLSGPARLLLRNAAVAGRCFDVELVSATLDAGADVSGAVGECTHRGFLVQGDLPGTLSFAQAAAHEAVLASLTKADRKHVHLRLAEAIERGAGAVDNPAEQMARHFLAAEQSRKGVKYLVLAADRLAERSEHAGAVDRYRHALGQLSREAAKLSPMPAESAALLLAVAAKAAAAQQMLAPAVALEILEPVLKQVPADRARAERAEALRQKGAALLKLSKVAEALAALREAVALAASEASPSVIAALNADLAACFEARGQLDEAVRILSEGLQTVAGVSGIERDLMWRYLNQLGRLHLRAGKPERAREFFENARGQAQRAGSLVGQSRATLNLAAAIAALGDPRAALPLVDEALEKAERAGDRVGIARAHFNAGRLLVGSGERDEGIKRLRLALDQSQRLGWREGIAAATQALASAKG